MILIALLSFSVIAKDEIQTKVLDFTDCEFKTYDCGRWYRRCPVGCFVNEVNVINHGTSIPSVYVYCHEYKFVCDEE